MRKTLRVPDPDPTSAPSQVPWPEVQAVVGTASVLVLTAADEASDVLAGAPREWLGVDDGRAEAIVAIDPLDGQAVAAAAAAAGDRPLVLVTPNLGRPSYVRALLVGGGDTLPGRGRLGAVALDRLLAQAGRRPLPVDPIQPAPTGRPLDDLLGEVAAGAGGDDRPWRVRRYDVAVAEPGPGGRSPFLSVLVRTQGRRPEALADVLLCLSAQTCDDVEVLVLAHDVEGEARATLDAQVAALPDAMRPLVRVVPVWGGGRSRPLRVGTLAARGAYVAVLDDDDLVAAHWVETFERGAQVAPGQVQRAVAVEQDVEPIDAPPGHRAASWPQARWDAEFSLLSHLVDNHSPIHSYACPREVFHELGLRFDESLPVLEDWDLLVRAASLVGVHDTGEVTATYLRWPARTSSFAELSEDRWPETAWRIVEKWDRSPLLLPAGSALRLRREGIATLRNRPLRERVRGRVDRERDRWAPRLMRTPFFPALRWVYRRLVATRPDRQQ